MSFLTRTVTRVPHARLSSPLLAASSRRYAHSSYGNEQSGHEQGTHEKNPKVHLEHPGPETPASKDGSSSGSPSKTEGGSKPSSGSSSQASNGAKPKIHEEHSPKEDSDPEVKKHNDEMKQRADRSHNQLPKDDDKVDKKFWKGDVGDMSQEKK